MRDVMKGYCITVLLGKPTKRTFSVLFGLCRRSRVLWLTHRAPLYARLMGVTVMRPPMTDTSLLRELCLIAEQNEGKMLTLLPATEEMKNFIKKNKDRLEQSYRIKLG